VRLECYNPPQGEDMTEQEINRAIQYVTAATSYGRDTVAEILRTGLSELAQLSTQSTCRFEREDLMGYLCLWTMTRTGHPETLVRETLAAQAAGFRGAKIKVGKAHVSEDVARLSAVREAVGPGFEIMVDANQCFTLAEALRRVPHYAKLGIAWFEEPLPADDLQGHVRLAANSEVPIAVGESLYSPGSFADYVRAGATHIVQVDVARVGGITPWLKVAHLAEACNLAVAPHFLMELHVSLCGATPAARWVEYIPQLDAVATSRLAIEHGHALVPQAPGLGIAWIWDDIERRAMARARLAR
jgi:L-alanine-DL-glutamate epimerase-like enolase superfamily enzyme